MFKKLLAQKIFWVMVLFLIVNIFFLTKYPFVHSDEPWLSGLTRNMLEKGSLSVTETFFDAYPRNPHAIKILFHIAQMPFMIIFGYNIFSFRLMSLAFGAASLFVFYRCALKLGVSEFISLLAACVMAADVQFIYASHFARQEIVITFLMLLSFSSLLTYYETRKLRFLLYSAFALAAGFFVHPNGFVAACMIYAVIIYGLCHKKITVKNAIAHLAVVAAGGALVISVSLIFDNQFFAHYIAYGSELGVFEPPAARLPSLAQYFIQLFWRVSGTYYTPEIKFQLLLFSFLLLASVVTVIAKSRLAPHVTPLLSALAGLMCGIVIIGRYNQTAIIFFFPFFYLLMAVLSGGIPRRGLTLFAVLAVTAAVSVFNIAPWLQYDYGSYLAQIKAYVPAGAKTLCNLNAEYAFTNGALIDYRNLSRLPEHLTVENYIRLEGVEYIVYPSELDFIYSQRPRWNGIYGNLSWHDDMKTFLAVHCEPLYSFTDDTYCVRIVRYMNSGLGFSAVVYKVVD